MQKGFGHLRKMQTEHNQKYRQQQQRLGNFRAVDFQTQMGPDSHVPELGDACIAAPFTYKFSSIKCVKKVVSQGRTTISTTYQMYKILAMNSILSAYSMSAMYLDGVKISDFQATVQGIGMGILFMLISLSKPLKSLHKVRPPHRLFHISFITTVTFQFLLHFATLYYLINLSEPFIERGEDTKPDTDFAPNLKNSVVFIYSLVNVVTTFMVNYEGEPMMQSLSKNTKLKKVIAGLYFIAVLCILDVEMIREYFELVPFPNEDFQMRVIVVLALDSALCLGVAKLIKRLYAKSFD